MKWSMTLCKLEIFHTHLRREEGFVWTTQLSLSIIILHNQTIDTSGMQQMFFAASST